MLCSNQVVLLPIAHDLLADTATANLLFPACKNARSHAELFDALKSWFSEMHLESGLKNGFRFVSHYVDLYIGPYVSH